MRKLLFLLVFFSQQILYAQSDDDNIVINKQEVTYTFKVRKADVQVKMVKRTDYECTKRSDDLSASIFYDDMSTIDKAEVHGASAKPTYHQCSSEDIFYSDDKVCNLDFSFGKKGDKRQVTFEKTYNEPRYVEPVFLSEPYFIRQMIVKVVVPKEIDIALVDRNFSSNIVKTIQENGNAKTYIFTVTNQKAMKDEPKAPDDICIYPHVVFWIKSATLSTGKQVYLETLDDQYKWYHSIVSQLNTDETVVKKLSGQITALCKTDMEKVRAILAWVQTNIRYIAFENGIAGMKPDEAQNVIRKKYGDCKGMANLLRCLLKAEGFDARLTWLGSDRLTHGYEIPSVYDDNHMICTLFLNSKPYYLDATAEYLPFGIWPDAIQGQEALVENGDKYLHVKLPVFPPSANTDSLNCVYTIEKDCLHIRASDIFTGESKQMILAQTFDVPKDKQDEALKIFVKNENQGSEVVDVNLQNVTPQSDKVVLNFTVNAPDKLQKFDNECYVSLDYFEDWNDMILDLEKREQGFKLFFRNKIVCVTTLNATGDYFINDVPQNLTIARKYYTISLSYKKLGNKVVYKKVLQLNSKLIPRADLQQLNDDIAKLKKAYHEQVTLVKKK